MQQKIFLFTILLCLGFNLFGQKYSNDFLNIGVGARAQGMGNAFVASVNDVTSGYWNTAGLMHLDGKYKYQAAAMHSEWFAGIGKFDYLGFAMPIAKNRVVGIQAIRFGIDDIPNTLNLYDKDGRVNYDNILPFSAADYGFLFNYAQNLTVKKEKLSVGTTLKLIYRKIGSFANAFGFGLDLGAQYEIGHWDFGFSGKDITTTFNAWRFSFSDQDKSVFQATGNDIPDNSLEITKPKLTLGSAFHTRFKKYGIRSEIDMIFTTDGKRNTLLSADPFSMDVAVGLEADYKELVYFRLGANNFQKDKDLFKADYWTVEPTMGLGIHYHQFALDYAYTDVGESRNNTYSHIISLVVGFGK